MAKKATAKKKPQTKKKPAPAPKSTKATSEQDRSFAYRNIVPVVLFLSAFFFAFCVLFPSASGILGGFVRKLLSGLFSGGAFIFPVLLGILAFTWKKDVDKNTVGIRIFSFVMFFLNICIFWHGTNGTAKLFDPVKLYTDGTAFKGGGAIGGFIASCIQVCIGSVLTIILSILIMLIFGALMFGITPTALYKKLGARLQALKEKRKERTSQVIYEDKPEPFFPDDYDENDYAPGDVSINDYISAGNSDTANELPRDPSAAIDGLFDDDMEDPAAASKETIKAFNQASETADDIDNIFDVVNKDGKDAPPALEVERSDLAADKPEDKKAGEAKKPEPPKKKPEYVFPPVDLLTYGKSTPRMETPEQLKQSAKVLVDTLASFHVKTRLLNISRGPTITRYELAPEEGVRVRAIANLVDDISLKLAASGVRIEAPIPGKAAVGIEVPNRTVATVYLRELIENENFSKNKSRVNVALGMDVAGNPIYLDISKMPHLLIAGATGMGKSVCINSMIVSLLYKASPDEVKLMLIDPKKVELNIYNSLPHLLVPVVSDPKKAAGSLQWAVKEMERRFELIESVGVRDIYNYNNETKNDPSYEFLPHIVIIIDELADLMMTAPDSVENSICRLAQKARAAGMHLVIGTQRPSVDVITGLIKANVPSRIAFTVASQVDSRTIIDISGAEKLIGRGDMLYAPVGAAKPIRVQGAFVSEQEVEAITGFIKDRSGDIEYSSEVLENIDREAARCVTKKSASDIPDADASAVGGSDAALFDRAVELAIDSGKISTSLIQRKLSLGYGKAAKLIDMMEERGIVGAPDGNKPRAILMTRETYLEMKMAQKDTSAEDDDEAPF